jgi:hypothetical protein
MEFGDRFCESLADHKSRWKAYWRHLASNGFSVQDALYRYFAAEVFHDRPVELIGRELNRGCMELLLTNSFALNEVRIVSGKAGSTIDVLDFQTIVRFEDLRKLQLFRWQETAVSYYYQAEISKTEAGLCVEIEVGDERNFESEHGSIQIECTRVSVSDITPMIQKYLPSGENAERFLTRISRNPEDFLLEY